MTSSMLTAAKAKAANPRAAEAEAAATAERIGKAAKAKQTAEGNAETEAFLESSRTGRPVTWERTLRRAPEPGEEIGEAYSVSMRADAGTYRPESLVALCHEAARIAARKQRAEVEDLAADLIVATLARTEADRPDRMPLRGSIGTDDSIPGTRDRDRAYLIGIARHLLADKARSGDAEALSLDRAEAGAGEGLDPSSLMETAERQAHQDPGLIDPDADPVTRDSWGAVNHFPTRDTGRAALAVLIGTRATRADLARAAGLANPKDWHKSVKRGRPALAALAEPPQQWTARTWDLAEAVAVLAATEGPGTRGRGMEGILASPPVETYREPKLDWPDLPADRPPAPVTTYPPRPNRAAAVVAWLDYAEAAC